MGSKPFLKQLSHRFALVAVSIKIMHLARIVLPDFAEVLFAREAYRRFRQCVEIGYRSAGEGPQLGSEHSSVILVSVDHTDEVFVVKDAAKRDNRK